MSCNQETNHEGTKVLDIGCGNGRNMEGYTNATVMGIDECKEFIEKIYAVGLTVSNAPIKIIKINKKIEFKDGDRVISISPSRVSLEIEFELKYGFLKKL